MFFNVSITFDLASMSEEQQEALKLAEQNLVKAGVFFDTGTGFNCRDWELGFIEGPAKITVFGALNDPEDPENEDDIVNENGEVIN